MQQLETTPRPSGAMEILISLVGRIVVSLFVPIVTFLVLLQGFFFLAR